MSNVEQLFLEGCFPGTSLDREVSVTVHGGRRRGMLTVKHKRCYILVSIQSIWVKLTSGALPVVQKLTSGFGRPDAKRRPCNGND